MGTAETLQSWLPVAVSGAAALWTLHLSLRSVRRDRIIADTPLARLRSAAQGYVRVFGRTKPAVDPPTAAPLSARPCVWWSYEVEVEESTSRGRSAWRTIDRRTSIEPFLIDDGDGTCLVGPVNAEITPTTRSVWYGDTPMPRSPPAAHGWLRRGAYRYTERLIDVGARVTVVGQLRSQSELGDIAAATATRLRQWKLDQPRLVARFDTNHDGRIDGGEWEAVRQAAEAEVRRQSLGAPIDRTSVIGQPTNGEPFVIAAMDGARLVRREATRAILFFGAGLAATALCAWALERACAIAAT